MTSSTLVGFGSVSRVANAVAAALVSTVALAARHGTADGDTSYDVSGSVELYYQWNVGDPSNGITAWRGFDNRHDSITLANASIATTWRAGDVRGVVALQTGATGATYYAAEPALAGAPGANASGPDLWRSIQQANVTYAPKAAAWDVAAGVFLSPIGPESVVIHDNWNWSRSNLFFGLPFYHAGGRAKLAFGADNAWAGALGVYNGYNSIVDNNRGKSVMAQLTYSKPEVLALSVLYFGGNERPSGAPEGTPWRHLLDAHATIYLTETLTALLHVNGGLESGELGTSSWLAGAAYLRYAPSRQWAVAGRADVFHERAGQASAMFWPTAWLGSGTCTLTYAPTPHASLQLEVRRDQAEDPLFYRGDVATDATGMVVANADEQTTITLGATAWF